MQLAFESHVLEKKKKKGVGYDESYSFRKYEDSVFFSFMFHISVLIKSIHSFAS